MAGKQQQMIPMAGAGGRFMPKVIGTLVLLAVLALVIKHPTEAAAAAHTIWSAGASIVDGLAAFFQAVSQK